jgi:cardiolipin synthase A/B
MTRTILHLVFIGSLLGASSCSWLTRDARIRENVSTNYGVEDEEFRRSASALLGAPLVDDNEVVELLNGDRIFPAMVRAIREAEKTVTLETFIWSSGKVSDQFVEAIVDRARAGVKVHIIDLKERTSKRCGMRELSS